MSGLKTQIEPIKKALASDPQTKENLQQIEKGLASKLPVSTATHDPAYFAFITFTRLLDLAVPTNMIKINDADIDTFCAEMEAMKTKRDE